MNILNTTCNHPVNTVNLNYNDGGYALIDRDGNRVVDRNGNKVNGNK